MVAYHLLTVKYEFQTFQLSLARFYQTGLPGVQDVRSNRRRIEYPVKAECSCKTPKFLVNGLRPCYNSCVSGQIYRALPWQQPCITAERSRCGESAMETRVHILREQFLCTPCYEEAILE